MKPVSLLFTPSATELPTTTPGVPVRTAPTPLTALLPRGARLLRMGATGRDSSHPSPPKVPSPACTRTLAALLADEDVQEWAPFAAGTCVIAILVALLLHYYRRTALAAPVAQHAPFAATATSSALALYDPKMSYNSAGHTLYLPSLLRFPELCRSRANSDFSLPALTSWFFRSCGAPVVTRLTALPAGGPTLRLDGAALGAAARRTAVMLFHAVQPQQQQQQPGASLACAACAALALGVFAARRWRGQQQQDAHKEGVLTTPATFASGFMHEEAYDTLCADSDEREREHEHLVATPAVTRLLSFSRLSSPPPVEALNHLRASVGAAVVRAAPSSALRRSARVASKRKSVMGTRAATRQAAAGAR